MTATLPANILAQQRPSVSHCYPIIAQKMVSQWVAEMRKLCVCGGIYSSLSVGSVSYNASL